MKTTLKLAVVLSLVTLAVGCKLAVIVVEGGEVRYSGSSTCMAGSICIVDVTDPNFSETFSAFPHEGWYFEKWNLGDGFFCGGSTHPSCTLTFEGHEESKAVADMIASKETFYLMPVFKIEQNFIRVDGREWLQPALFTGLTWAAIDAVCPAGICSGFLNGYDMNGWTWGSVNDLNALFNYYIGRETLGPGPDSYSADHGSIWISAFFQDGWQDLSFFEGYISVGGRVRDSAEYIAGLVDSWTPGMGAGGDGVFTNDTFSSIALTENTGAWFYRDP